MENQVDDFLFFSIACWIFGVFLLVFSMHRRSLWRNCLSYAHVDAIFLFLLVWLIESVVGYVGIVLSLRIWTLLFVTTGNYIIVWCSCLHCACWLFLWYVACGASGVLVMELELCSLLISGNWIILLMILFEFCLLYIAAFWPC